MKPGRFLNLILSLFIFASTGCLGRKGDTLALPSAPSSAAAPTPTESPKTSCSTTVVDYGQKGTVAAVARGVYSDLKLIPGSAYPAMVFTDTGSIAIKLTYQTSSGYTTEVVSGDGAATRVRLAFLSTGVPIVVWATTTQLKAAIRSAPLDSAGTWNAAVIDAGTTISAIEIAVNPLDQVGVHFTTAVATGRQKFLYCDSPCTTPTSFMTMTPNAYIENTNAAAAVTVIGMAWCKVSSSVYYPAVAYGVTGNIARYAVCRQSSLSSCLNSANWSTSNIHILANTGNILHLDPTVVGDVPKVLSQRTGVYPYVMNASTACTAAPAAFTAGAIIAGTTNTGSQWMSLQKDSVGKFHLLGNNSTTSVVYSNSSTTTFNGAWNALGTVETTTLPAATGGGADIDTTNGVIKLAYGQNVANFDVRLGTVADYTVASNLATYGLSTPDLSGGIQLGAASSQRMTIGLGKTSAGKLGAVYVDYSIGAATAAKLKFAFRNGLSGTDPWDVNLIPGATSPQYPSVAYDLNNRPWVSFFDAGNNRFYLATNTSMDGTGVWSLYPFPGIPSGAPIALPAANQTAMAMYYSGGVAYPVMIVIDTNAISKGVKAAKFNPTSSTWSTVTTVDGLTAGALGASHLTTDFDTSGNIVIAYRERNLTRARYASSTDGGATWNGPLSVSSLSLQGAGVSVALNPSTSKPSLAYYHPANNWVIYANCSGTVASCGSGGWSTTTVESLAGVSGVASASEQLLSTRLLFSSGGHAYLAYPRGALNDGHLVMTHNFSGSFGTPSIVSSGVNAALAGTAAINFGVAGWSVAGITNSSGGPTYLHVGPGNWLYSTSCGD